MIKKILFPVLAAGCVLGFVAAVFLLWNYQNIKNTKIRDTRDRLVKNTRETAKNIDEIFLKYKAIADGLSGELNSGVLTQGNFNARVQNILNSRPDIFGIGIVYAPHARDAKTRLYAPYWTRKGGKLQRMQLEREYDYTQRKPEFAWYHATIEKGAMWHEPYFDKAGGALMTTYAVPFSQKGAASKISGIVTLDVDISTLRKIMIAMDAGETGFGALLSRKGVYLYHPSEERVKKQMTVFDIAKKANDARFSGVAEKITAGESGIVDHASTSTGKPSWVTYAPVPSTGWSLYTTFLKEEMDIDNVLMRHQHLNILTALILFLVSFCGLIFRVHAPGNPRKLWEASVIISLVFAAGTGYIWRLALISNSYLKTEGVKISDASGLQSYLNKYKAASAQRHEEAPFFVPTGVFIQSAEFSGTYNVTVTGYVWQKYKKGEHDGISRGFTLPEATSASVEESYRRKEGDTELIGWYFSATLRQRFNYNMYPMNRESVWIRLWHKDFDRNTVLVPDLESYEFLTPSLLPGLERDFVLPGWSTEKTFFEYRQNSYNTNFGIANYAGQQDFPEMYYNIVIKSSFVDAFISSMTPLLVVAFTLFSILLTMAKTGEEAEKLDFSVGAVLGGCSALLFAVIFIHASLRNSISYKGIMYIEYFYLIFYLIMLWLPVHAFLFLYAKNSKFIQYKDSLLSKVLFWPALLGAVFMLTLRTFY